MIQPVYPTSRHHGSLHFLLGLGLLGLALSSCGSRKDEDVDPPSGRKEAGSGSAHVSINIPGASEDQTGSSDPCQVILKQSQEFVGGGIRATFQGSVEVSTCAVDGKKPILFIRTGDAKFQPPVELDCQPKPRGEWNVRCLNASRVLTERGDVKVVIDSDANYRGSQVSIMLAFEKP